MKYLIAFTLLFIIFLEKLKINDKTEAAYRQGKTDAQNECIVEETIQDTVLLDKAIEQAKWECASRINRLLQACGAQANK